jgi:hypothetical protein
MTPASAARPIIVVMMPPVMTPMVLAPLVVIVLPPPVMLAPFIMVVPRMISVAVTVPRLGVVGWISISIAVVSRPIAIPIFLVATLERKHTDYEQQSWQRHEDFVLHCMHLHVV